MRGSVTKRCGCPPTYNAKGQRVACRLDHGSWSFVTDTYVTDPTTGYPKRRQVRRAGFRTKADAERALAELVDASGKGVAVHDGGQSVAAYLESWLSGKVADGLRPSTAHSYRQHIDDYLRPHLGAVRLRDLRPTHVEAMLRAIAAPRGDRRPLSAASVRRVHATLRSALASAKRRRLITYNPSADLDLPKVTRPKVRPWEPDELGAFLDAAAGDVFGPLFEVMAMTGLRRGEAVGLRWDDVDLTRRRLTVHQQVVQAGEDGRSACPYCGVRHMELAFGKPKTASGENRTVDLDAHTVGVLLAHRLTQDAERAAWGPAYVEHGLVFAREDGNPIPPTRVGKRFDDIVAEHGLRKVRLHDLRHGRASLLLASGTDIAVVSKLLGHSSISITSDTYSHLLEGVGREAADRAAALVPRTHRDQADAACDQLVTSQDQERPSDVPAQNVSAGQAGGAGGARTHDRRIMSPLL